MNENKQWITEKCGTNITPPNPPKKPSIGNKTLRKIKSKSRVKELEEKLNAQFAEMEEMKTNRCKNCKHHYTDYDCLHDYCNITDKEVSINDSCEKWE